MGHKKFEDGLSMWFLVRYAMDHTGFLYHTLNIKMNIILLTHGIQWIKIAYTEFIDKVLII